LELILASAPVMLVEYLKKYYGFIGLKTLFRQITVISGPVTTD